MAAMESKRCCRTENLLLVLDEGHHLPEVARDALEMSAEITPGRSRLQLDLFIKLVATCLEQFRPKTVPPLATPERLANHCDEIAEHLGGLSACFSQLLPDTAEGEYRFPMGAAGKHHGPLRATGQIDPDVHATLFSHRRRSLA